MKILYRPISNLDYMLRGLQRKLYTPSQSLRKQYKVHSHGKYCSAYSLTSS